MIYDFVWTDFSSTVPVRYSDMNVYKNGQSTVFDWQTVTEDNCKHFNVLHSKDGINFLQIGSIDTKAKFGNSAKKLYYQFVDQETRTGINYYRLEQVDIDNKTNLSPVFDIVWGGTGSIITIFPNPVTDEMNINLSVSSAALTEIKLVDMSGRIVKSVVTETVKGFNQNTLLFTDLTPGLYGVQIFENNKLTHVSKVLKN